MRTAKSQVLPGKPNLHSPQATSTTCTFLLGLGIDMLSFAFWLNAGAIAKLKNRNVKSAFMM